MVTIIKQSGNPVNNEEAEAYNKEWKEGFDKLFDVKGDMAIVSEKAREYEEELSKKYGTKETVELPKSMKAWKILLEKSKGPIMIDQSTDNGDLIFIILDLGL
tara:strand:- start:280 stop:588 length:309 start_codon:yes stop_codon:yes gene_type:complete